MTRTGVGHDDDSGRGAPADALTPDPTETVAHLRAVIADLQQEVQALRDRKRDIDAAMSAAGIGVSYRDITADRINLSRSLVALLGLPDNQRHISRDEFLARTHPEDRDRVGEEVRTAAAEGREFQLEYRFDAGVRGWRWFRSVGRVEPGGTHRQPQLYTLIVDVTERRSLERQLEQAQKMDAIGRLAGGVAHDFNNLLTAINGNAQMIAHEPDLDRLREYGREILSAGTRAARLTKQLLAVSRRQVMESATLDLNTVVAEMAGMLRRMIGTHIELTALLAPDPPLVRGDRGQVEQVIMNLVLNARDAIAESGSIQIATASVPSDAPGIDHPAGLKPGTYAVIAVIDDGTGMSEAVRARVFEPFFTTKKRGDGTGLGLAVAYGIVSQMGGGFVVSSEPGKGTTFRAYLPHAERPAIATGAGAQPQAGGTHGTETVLLVEDERSVRVLAAKVLRRAGYTVIEAGGPAEAEALTQETLDGVDLLLTDVVMPGSTGPELFRRLSQRRPDLPVLFMSGYAEAELFERMAFEPGPAFISKPFLPDALAQKVRERLDQR